MKTQGFFKNQRKSYSQPFNYYERNMTNKIPGAAQTISPGSQRGFRADSSLTDPLDEWMAKNIKSKKTATQNSKSEEAPQTQPDKSVCHMSLPTELDSINARLKKLEDLPPGQIINKTVYKADYDKGTLSAIEAFNNYQNVVNKYHYESEKYFRETKRIQKLLSTLTKRVRELERRPVVERSVINALMYRVQQLEQQIPQGKVYSEHSTASDKKYLDDAINQFNSKIAALDAEQLKLEKNVKSVQDSLEPFVTQVANIIEEKINEKASIGDLDVVLSSISNIESSVQTLTDKLNTSLENLPKEVQNNIKTELKENISSLVSKLLG